MRCMVMRVLYRQESANSVMELPHFGGQVRTTDDGEPLLDALEDAALPTADAERATGARAQ